MTFQAGFGYVWAITVLTNICCVLVLTYIRWDEKIDTGSSSVVRKSAKFYRKKELWHKVMIIVVNVLIYDDTNEYRVYLGGGVELRSRAPGGSRHLFPG